MADDIAAVFDQGLVDQLEVDKFSKLNKSKVKLHFTAPPDAQAVEIKFFEVDSWVSDGKTPIKESDKPARLIGTSGGKIAGGKYTETSQILPPPSKVKLLLEVDIDDSPITMPIPDPNNDTELDFFEVSFKVTARVNGALRTYESPSPLFVRNTPTPRAELALIAGDGTEFPDDASTRRYFSIAAQYWRRIQDNRRSTALSLQSIFLFLRQDDDSSVRARNSLPWGRINIVSHGDDGWDGEAATFTATWFIKLRDGDKIDDDFGFTASKLAGPGADPGVLGPRRKEVDEHTEIVIRGCVIGNDVSMLNAIRDKFGGLATVFAPKFENNYRIEKDGVTRDRLFDCWTVFLPGDLPFPDQARLSALLKARYQKHPLYGSFSDSDWAAVAGITAPLGPGVDQFRQRIPERTGEESNEFDEAEIKGKNQTELTALMRSHTSLKPQDFDRFAWHWTVKPPKKKSDPFVVSGTGVRTSFEIFRIVTTQGKGQGVPVTPDHRDPAQFGRSS